jgi:hypothetical protein
MAGTCAMSMDFRIGVLYLLNYGWAVVSAVIYAARVGNECYIDATTAYATDMAQAASDSMALAFMCFVGSIGWAMVLYALWQRQRRWTLMLTILYLPTLSVPSLLLYRFYTQLYFCACSDVILDLELGRTMLALTSIWVSHLTTPDVHIHPTNVVTTITSHLRVHVPTPPAMTHVDAEPSMSLSLQKEPHTASVSQERQI